MPRAIPAASRSSMSSTKKTGSSAKPAGKSKKTAVTEGNDPPQWAQELIEQVQKLETKFSCLWNKCNEVISHINSMDERRFQTGRKLWNTIAESSIK